MSILSRALSFILLLLLLIAGCKPETPTQQENTVTVRLANEPDMLNPARSASPTATQIESQILLPLAEIDPFNYTLEPLLITHVPPPENITEGRDSGGVVFHYEIRPEARWEDGSPVTGEDYAFTVKMALDPKVDVAQWRGFLSFITDVVIDPDDPRKFDVTVAEPYVLADLVTCNFNVYPKYVYDPDGYLDSIPVRSLSNMELADSLAESDPRLQQFAEAFMQPKFAKEVIVGNGPYHLASWETGQRIVLKRVQNWWGDQIADGPTLLHAYPQKLIYEIVPDENTALTMLKDGAVDVVSGVTPTSFVALRQDAAYKDKLQFFTPKLTVYNYLALNNHKPILSDKLVRKALAHVVDYEGMINQVMLGMAERTIGPIHPDLDYYNHQIKPVTFDLDAARSLLAEAGWKDTNGDGILDKVIGGKRTELSLDITVTQKGLGQSVALLIKENAAKVGIAINIKMVEGGTALIQDLRSRSFDIMPLRNLSPVTLSDPYQTWNSASDAPGGKNYAGFHNAEVDSLTSLIRRTNDVDKRNQAFMTLQQILADAQPVIFLFVPLERIVISKRFEARPSARTPGYFEQLFELREG